MKAFHELVGAAFDGENSTTKVAFLRNWIPCYANLLELHVTLVEQERDLAKGNHDRALPGYRNLTLAKIQIEEAKLGEIEESIIDREKFEKPEPTEVIVPGGEKMMYTLLPLSLAITPTTLENAWWNEPSKEVAIVTGDKKWARVKFNYHADIPERSVMMSKPLREKYKLPVYSRIIFAEEAITQTIESSPASPQVPA